MAEFASIARPYAKGLFDLVKDLKKSELKQIVDWTQNLSLIAQDSNLRQLSLNPKTSKEELFILIQELLSKLEISSAEVLQNFLRLIIKNSRLDILPEVANQFQILVNKKQGSADAIIFSAFPLTKTKLNEIKNSLQERFERKLNLKTEIDESLIGGVKIVVGDEVLDTSVKASLEQMKTTLMN